MSPPMGQRYRQKLRRSKTRPTTTANTAKKTTIHAVTCGERTTPSCSSAQVSRTNIPVAHQMLRKGFGSRRAALASREVHSLRAPKGQARHQTRPTSTKVKMMPAHQIVHVRSEER